jgi:Nuclease-related domain
MRVLRAGGRYLEGREQRLWLALASVVGLSGAGIILVTHGEPLQWAGVAAALGALPLGAKISHRLASVRKGRLGERLVTDLLRRLPDDYWLANDVMLGRTRGNVDHVLIGPCGVVVIETKRLAGRICCWADEWSVNGHSRGSISKQLNSGASAVRSFLAERYPALRWVESIVVFTHPLCRLEVNHARTTVVRYSELVQVILELAKKHRMGPATAARLAERLADSQTTVA